MKASAHPAPDELEEHAVRFYTDDEALARSVGAYLADAVLAGGAAVVIATAAHREAFARQLSGKGLDVSAAVDEGTVVLLDAAATLTACCRRGKLDSAAFQTSVGDVIRGAADHGGPIRAFGEMVALLWEEGDVLGAIELEELWNELGRETHFSLMCGYRESALSGAEHQEELARICQLHTSVQHAPRLGAPARRRLRPAETAAEFPPGPDTPGLARQFLSNLLREQAPGDPTLRQDACLVISELVTNAVCHARSPVSVVVSCQSTGLRLAIHDFATSPLEPDRRGSRTGLGMGLKVVESLAGDWGVEPTPDGKTVWAVLPAGRGSLSPPRAIETD